MTIRIVVADDHPLIRMGVRQVLSGELGFVIVDEASSVDGLLGILAFGKCDVLVTGLCMPGVRHADGLEMLETIRRKFPAIRVVVLTMQENAATLQGALDAGACAVLGKSSRLAELPRAIVAAHQRRSYIGKTIRRDGVTSSLPGIGAGMGPLAALSPREAEVVRLYVSGMSVSGVAQHLNRSIKTVSTHKICAMKKLGIRSDADLCRYGVQNGLVEMAVPCGSIQDD